LIKYNNFNIGIFNMSKKIASARISTQSSKLLQELNNSLPFDKLLYREDITGSLAHAKMLNIQGIISDEDYSAIKSGLEEILVDIDEGRLLLDGDDEDIHMAIEGELTRRIGDAGKRLHTARSRNDQVALDFRMYVQRHSLNLANLLLANIQTLLEIAKKHHSTMLPGMTHLQHAQPINFGYHMMAYASMFKRDYERFIDSYERNNLSPIGCAALAGTPHPIDREVTAKELGFNEPTLNCLDTVSDRDFALEILFNIATMMMHISRLSEELILWSAAEFKWVTLSDRHATGSSIMPQKKNPDIPELLRGKTGRANGNLIALLTTMKGLPLAYNKDMQEDKEGVFDSVKTATLTLEVLNEMMAGMSVNVDAMEDACMVGHLSATDLADYLVKERGLAFRDAYHITGNVVNLAEEIGKDISQLTATELQSIDERIGEDVVALLDLRASMNARTSQGGTATSKVKEQIDRLESWLNNL
jgi:argininosuccinate lyase